MAKKLPTEELLKMELGDFYALADDTVREKALAKIRKKYNVAEQTKAARTTRTTKKAARAACDSPKEKRVGRPQTNPEGTGVWAVRVTDSEKENLKKVLAFLRKYNDKKGLYNLVIIFDDDNKDSIGFLHGGVYGI